MDPDRRPPRHPAQSHLSQTILLRPQSLHLPLPSHRHTRRAPQHPPDRPSLRQRPPNKPPNAKLSAPTTPLDATKATPLDGTKSQDPEGKPLSYQWTQIAGPPAFIENPNTAKPNLIPLSYGFITLALTVSDGTTQSLPSTVQLSVHDAQNHVPIANAGDDQEVLAGVKVTLDGTQSQDLDPTDTLSYTWTQIAPDPTEEPVQLSGQSAPKALFFIPSNTDIRSYTFGLIVDDGKISSLQDTVQIKVIGVNKAPKSIPNAPESARVNDTVTLDGTQSKDPNPSDTLSYTWRQTGGAKTSLRNVQSPKASFTPALPGTYAFALTVSDGTLSHNDTVTILVQQPPAPPSQGCQSIPQPLAHFPLLALFFLLLLSKTSRI